MKKQLSSLDMHFLLKELKDLKDSRIDKIYNSEKTKLIFSFYKSNAGKRLLQIDVGKSLFIAETKEDYGGVLGFGMFLRKKLDGYFLSDLEQIEPERILKLSFKSKEDTKTLYIEFFGKGNAILCDENDIIINSLIHHEFKDRTIKPKIKYIHPSMKYNLFDINKNILDELFKNSKKDTVVISLATELGLGGIYSEEMFLLAKVEKNTNPKNISNDEIESLLKSIKKILSNKINPNVILDKDNPIDVAPFELEYYKKHEKKEFDTFSEAFSFFHSHFKEVKKTEFDKKLEELNRIIEGQKVKIDNMNKEEKESRANGELIYHKYKQIKDILDEINKASEKYPWKEIKEKLKGHKLIKEINLKERKVVVEI